MKTVNGLFEKIIDPKNIEKGLLEASLGKRHKKDVQYALKYKDEIVKMIHESLSTMSWNPDHVHRIKIINDGVSKKKREIVCPDFVQEHVIHHIIMRQCKEIFLKRFYKHSYASIPGYGGIENMVKYIRHIMKDRHRTKYFVKLDIKQFYNSIDPNTVYESIKRIIRDKRVLRLFRLILDSNLINHPDCGIIRRGTPIGLYTSQWFANILLTRLDNQIKSFGKRIVPYYIRYNDDMIIFSPNKRKLKLVIKEIKRIILSLNLRLKHNAQIHQVSKNKIIFAGSKITYTNITLTSKTFIKMRRYFIRLRKKLDAGKMINAYNAKRAMAYRARCRSYDVHDFLASYSLPFRKFRRTISKNDKKRRRA